MRNGGSSLPLCAIAIIGIGAFGLLVEFSVSAQAQCVGLGCDGPLRDAYRICCNQLVYDPGATGVGADRSKPCDDYLNNNASPEVRGSICAQIMAEGAAICAKFPSAACKPADKICPAAALVCSGTRSTGRYCSEDMPENGFIYAGTLDGRIRSGPSSSSSVIGSPPSGTRMRYTRVQRVDGETWYYVRQPGGPEGWFAGNDVSCGRPINPPATRQTVAPPSSLPVRPPKAPCDAGYVPNAIAWFFDTKYFECESGMVCSRVPDRWWGTVHCTWPGGGGGARG